MLAKKSDYFNQLCKIFSWGGQTIIICNIRYKNHTFIYLCKAILQIWITTGDEGHLRASKNKRSINVGKVNKFLLTRMGVLAPGSAHARPSAWPPTDMSGNCRGTCLQSLLKTSPPIPLNFCDYSPPVMFQNTN